MVWERLGDVDSYVEPFFGSGAVLLNRPHEPKIETCNDRDGYVVNWWRAVQADPDAVARYAANPVFEIDKHARHAWLVHRKDSLPAKLEGDPDYYDAKVAGWWVWGKCCHIGSGWCSGEGPWKVVDGQLLDAGDTNGDGISRQIPHLAGPGQGVNRSLPQIPARGVNIPDGIEPIKEWFRALQNRLRRVRFTCGDWSRITGPSITHGNGTCGVFLDPPYSGFEEWYSEKSSNMSEDVRKWAIEAGEHPDMRICLAGYEEEHGPHMPKSWLCLPWKAAGGYGLQRKDGKNENNKRERLWFSPNCLKPELDLFSRA